MMIGDDGTREIDWNNEGDDGGGRRRRSREREKEIYERNEKKETLLRE